MKYKNSLKWVNTKNYTSQICQLRSDFRTQASSKFSKYHEQSSYILKWSVESTRSFQLYVACYINKHKMKSWKHVRKLFSVECQNLFHIKSPSLYPVRRNVLTGDDG